MRANYRKYEGGWAWVPYAIAGAASLAGGLFGGRTAQKGADADRAQQQAFAENSIRWRVEDAKNAGVHPVYALGAQGASFAPVGDGGAGALQSRGIESAGASIGQAVKANALFKMQTEAHNASVAKDHAMATMYANEAARIRQAMNSGGAGYKVPGDVVVGAYKGGSRLEEHPLYEDAVKLEPDPMVSRSATEPGQTAGQGHPSMREFEMANGDKLLLPATSGGGIPEEIDFSLIPEIIGANIRRYGFRQAVFGALTRWLGGKRVEQALTPEQRRIMEGGFRPGWFGFRDAD